MKPHEGEASQVIILTEHFWPSTGATAQLVSDLADDLSRSGKSPVILTSTPGEDYRNQYKIKRLAYIPRSSSLIHIKILRGLVYLVTSLAWLLLNTRNGDQMIVVSNPPFIGVVGLIAKFVTKASYIFLLQDVFPRSASLSGILPSKGPLYGFWRRLISHVVAQSSSTVVLSHSMMNRCAREFGHTHKLTVIPNWSILPEKLLSTRINDVTESWGISRDFIVQYSGNFGRLHDILTILETARLLNNTNIKFVFIGGGAKAAQISKYSSEYNLKNVLIKPYQPRELLPMSLAACDLSIVSLIPGAEDTVAPSKLYGILASHKPVLMIASQSSEHARTIQDFDCGVVVEQGDVLTLVESILSLYNNPARLKQMSENAYLAYQSNYGRKRSFSKYLKILNNASIQI